ncbi:MAG: AmmeMemoRadiSam system protein B [Methanocorpusculum parvum]|nr:AmmeMemoRadiSam system protein B [Methanocorpusculum parvum]
MIHKISAEPQVSEKSARLPTLAGIFYPSEAEELKNTLAALFDGTVTAVSNPKGILVPHAGFIYSGPCAAVSYARISPDFDGTFVIIGTSHKGFSNSVSDIDWETPLGTIAADKEFVQAIPLPIDNAAAREQENSIETQMPFIAFRFPRAKIAAVLMGNQSQEGAETVARAVLSAVEKTKRNIIVVASGDGSHYVPAKTAERDDLTCLAALKNLDVNAFYDALYAIQPSMCGYGCLAATAEIGKTLGAKEARVLTYTTSGDASGDYRAVVGYAALEVI